MTNSLSIHGNDIKTGKNCGRPYNPAPQEPQAPTTARGKRRAAAKAEKSTGSKK